MATTQHISTPRALRALAAAAAAAVAAITVAADTASPAASAPALPSASACAVARTLLAGTPQQASSTKVIATRPPHAVTRHSYNWPLKPFDRQHPIRAYFNDPREGGGGSHAFHFGIDIAAPDGTAVYAVEAGTVYFSSPVSLAVLSPDRSHEFGYWHILPVVKSHQIVGRHQLLGHIGPGWEHVHFAESWRHRYVNPLRPGALTPYADHTAPTIGSIALEQRTGGRIDVVAEAYDTVRPHVPGAWGGKPVTPALLQWRLVREGAQAPAWRTAVDFRDAMVPARLYHVVYAAGTHQNHKNTVGHYCFNIARGWNAAALPNGSYRLQVRAADTWRNSGRLDLALTIENGEVTQ